MVSLNDMIVRREKNRRGNLNLNKPFSWKIRRTNLNHFVNCVCSNCRSPHYDSNVTIAPAAPAHCHLSEIAVQLHILWCLIVHVADSRSAAKMGQLGQGITHIFRPSSLVSNRESGLQGTRCRFLWQLYRSIRYSRSSSLLILWWTLLLTGYVRFWTTVPSFFLIFYLIISCSGYLQVGIFWTL